MRSYLNYIFKICQYLFILLFVYTATSKFIDLENFKIQLAQSPLLSAYADIIAYTVIIGELLVALLLCFRKTLQVGLFLFLGFMSAFTVYIYLILNYSPFIPCSCGGVLEKMGWTEHLWFNVIFCFLALLSIFMGNQRLSFKKTSLLSFLTVLISVATVIYLYQSSEYLMRKENPFTRRFLPHPISQPKYYDLKVNSYYIAGLSKDTLYLGNYTAPLLVTAIPMDMSTTVEHFIKLDDADFNFSNLRLKVYRNTFYLSDGTIPIIYKGSIENWNGNKFMQGNVYFTALQPISNNKFIFRSQKATNQELVLGKLTVGDSLTYELLDHALEKQIDGIFDTDGQLIIDSKNNQSIYTYYYRNQYIVYDPSTHLISKGNTIDTVSTAQIQVTSLKNGEKKLSAPPQRVNSQTYSYDSLLYIHSSIIGKNERREMWNQSSTIDVYNYIEKEYEYSFYIYNYNQEKIREFALNKTYVFGLFDKSLVRYNR